MFQNAFIGNFAVQSSVSIVQELAWNQVPFTKTCVYNIELSIDKWLTNDWECVCFLGVTTDK